MKTRYNLALSIAADAHFGQKRAGSSDPYLVHPLAAAGIAEDYNLSPEIILALVCHDVIEDGGDPDGYRIRIRKELGEEVLSIVEGLSDPDFAPGTLRKEKKRIINERLSQQPDSVQLAKLCDVKDNTKDIERAKPEFAPKYLLEKRDQLRAMSPSVQETTLWQDSYTQIETKLWNYPEAQIEAKLKRFSRKSDLNP